MPISSAKIDVTKVKKEWLFVGKNGAKYLDLILVETQNSQYGDTHMVCQSVPKEVKQANPNMRGPIVGNARLIQSGSRPAVHDPKPPPKSDERPKPPEEDDVPF